MTRKEILPFFWLIMLVLVSTAAGAASMDTDLHHHLLNARHAGKPYVSSGSITFTYQPAENIQSVSLALEHEDFRVFHTFERNPHGVFILTLPLPENSSHIRYRLIIDGLWTTDPHAETRKDNRGIPLSYIAFPLGSSAPAPGVRRQKNGSTRFVFIGNPGSRVTVIGDFNQWDPYISPLQELQPGIFETTLNLSPGNHYYRLVVNGQEMADPANPRTVRNGWGRDLSLIP